MFTYAVNNANMIKNAIKNANIPNISYKDEMMRNAEVRKDTALAVILT